MSTFKMSAQIFTFLIVLYASQLFAYEPPVGVPDPGFGIEEVMPSRPSDWSQPVVGYYFVSYATGSDSSNTYGTPSSPRRSLPRPVPAGSYVEIQGAYSLVSGGVISVSASGTSGAFSAGQSGPVWLVGAKEGATGEFVNAKAVITGTYTYMDGLKFSSGSRLQLGSPTEGYAVSHFVVRNCDVEGLTSDPNGGLLSVNSHINTRSDNIVLYNNIVHDSGDINSSKDIDAHLVTVSGYSSYVWVLENTIYTASGAGLQVNGHPPSEACHHVFVGRNEVYNARQSGLWVKYGSDIVFSENYVHDIIDVPWSPAKGMGGQYEPNRLWMINNRIHNVSYGIRIASTNPGEWNVYAIGNIIYNINTNSNIVGRTAWENAGVHIQGGTNRYIFNNLIYNAPHGINVSSTTGTNILYNNIIAEVDPNVGNHIWVENAVSGASIDNNVLYQSSTNVNIKWGSRLYNLMTFTNEVSKCTSCLELEPQFADVGAANFQVQNITSFSEKGTSIDEVLTLFNSLYGINIDKDIVGNDRKIGPIIDIGPYEYSDVISRPMPPSNLTIK